MTKLLVVNDGKRERELFLVERLVVGRDPTCDFSHDDGLLSRRHAEFATARDEVTVRDLGSRNGIFVNGTRTAESALRPGDIVQIGTLRVRYVADRSLGLAADDIDRDSTFLLPSDVDETNAPGTGSIRIAGDPVVGDSDSDSDAETATEDQVTRIYQASEDNRLGSVTVRDSGPPPEEDATVMVPPPRPGSGRKPAPSATLPIAASARPAPTGPVPLSAFQPPPRVVPVDAASLSTFVFVQVAALATVVFAASAIPLILWRDEVLDATAPGGVVSMLRWPVFPLAIALVTTFAVGTILTRKFRDMLIDARPHRAQDDASRGLAAPPRGFPPA